MIFFQTVFAKISSRENYILRPLSQRGELIVSLLTLLIANLIFFSNVSASIPLEPSDELTYMKNFRREGIDLDWSFPYTMWYRLLSVFTKDMISLYYLNSTILSASLTLVAFFSLLKLGSRPLVSLLGGIWALLWMLNSGSLIKVHHFNLILLMTSAIFINSMKISLDKKCILFSVGCLYLTFVRQESLFLACIFFQIFMGLCFSTKVKFDRSYIPYILVGGIGLFFLLTYSPMNRGWSAFIDHYYWVYRPDVYGPGHQVPNDLPLAGMFAKNQFDLIALIFPEANSILSAFAINPLAVFHAFKFRLMSLCSAFFDQASAHFSLFNQQDRTDSITISIETFIAISGLIGIYFLQRKKRNPIYFIYDNVFYVIVVVAVCLKTLALCLIVNAGGRYVIDFFFLCVVFFIAITTYRWKTPIPTIIIAPILIGLILMMPKTGTFDFREPLLSSEVKPHKMILEIIHHIIETNKSRNLARAVYFANPIYAEYSSMHSPTVIPARDLTIAEPSKDFVSPSIDEAMKRLKVDIVVIDQQILSDVKFTHYTSSLEPKLKTFTSPCFEKTFQNKWGTVWYRRPDCVTIR